MGTGTPLYGDRAPTIGQYVVIAGSTLLDNERTLTGTASQIVVTDNGAGSTVVLSTPQDIAATSSPTFVTVKLSGLTDGYIPYHVADATGLANSPIFTDGTKVGVGTAIPLRILHVGDGTDVDQAILIHAGGSTGKTAAVIFKTTNQTSDNYAKGAVFWEDDGSSNARGKLHLAVDIANDASNVSVSDAKITIDSTGNVGMGIAASIAGQVHIDQASSTGAEPVLFLDQGDVSEQCIQFSSDATDRDAHLFTVNVTGTPAMDWLETPDIFSLNKGLSFTAGSVDIEVGRISSATLTTAVAGPTDNLDVSGVNTVFLDCSGNDVTIGAFVGGVDGQNLHIARLCAGAFSAILEHNEGTANQNIFLHAGVDEEIDTLYGGWVLVCNGTSWFDADHAKHV